MSSGKCRVFVIYKHSLLAEGVMALLSQQQAVEVTGAETDTATALARVRDLHPDVVILDCTEGDPAYTIGCLLTECPGTRLITLSLKNDRMEIYDNYEVNTPHPADLMKAILLAREPESRNPAEGQAHV